MIYPDGLAWERLRSKTRVIWDDDDKITFVMPALKNPGCISLRECEQVHLPGDCFLCSATQDETSC